jgi:hypothetical protein
VDVIEKTVPQWLSIATLFVSIAGVIAIYAFVPADARAEVLVMVMPFIAAANNAAPRGISKTIEVQSDEAREEAKQLALIRRALELDRGGVTSADLEDDDSQEITRPSYYSEEAKNGRATATDNQQLRDGVRACVRPGAPAERMRSERPTDTRSRPPRD